MRLLLITLLIFFTTCGFTQKYIVKESIFYPNVFVDKKLTLYTPIEITMYGKAIVVKDSVRVYVIEKDKFIKRVPMEKGGHLNVYGARIGVEDVQLGYWYSKKGNFIGLQLKQGYSVVVFIVYYETDEL